MCHVPTFPFALSSCTLCEFISHHNLIQITGLQIEDCLFYSILYLPYYPLYTVSPIQLSLIYPISHTIPYIPYLPYYPLYTLSRYSITLITDYGASASFINLCLSGG